MDEVQRRFSLMQWRYAEEDPKARAELERRIGAHPHRAVRLSVFRWPGARLSSLDEAQEVALRNVRRNGQHEYWRARNAAGRALRDLRDRAAKVAPHGD